MGDVETELYQPKPYSEADTLARKIIREGEFLMRDCYRYKGEVRWVVNGRVLTREEAQRLEDERRREGRITR